LPHPPSGQVALKSLGKTAALLDRPIAKVEQLGSTETIIWSRNADALSVTPASARPASDAAIAFKIILK
jgi:alpha-L-fucosidase